MANHLETAPPLEITELVRGIVHDAHDLVEQQFKLFQVEIKNSLGRTRDAAVPLLVGVLVALVGAVCLASACGLLLSWLWPTLPLWGGFAIIGGALLLVGLLLALWGKCRLNACNEPAEPRADAVKENIPWKVKK
jgi:uncharacterized membrane protein YqjE